MKKLKIGNYVITNPFLLAPMVEVTDLSYRLICRKAGAGLAYTEMIYSSALIHENKKTLGLIQTSKEEYPNAIQITGNTLDEFKKVTEKLSHFNITDLNCGCPSVRIVGNKAGSYLLKNPAKISKIIQILKEPGYTVTAKIRLGFKKNNVLKIAKSVEKAGADALTLHTRLANQSYKTPADLRWLGKVKRELSIPLIGNGDIDSGEKAAAVLDVADGAMIARAAIGNPLIFKSCLHYLRTGREKYFGFRDNLPYLKEYLALSRQNDLKDISRVKYVSSSFLKGFEGASKQRMLITRCKSFEEIEDILDKL